MRGDVLGAAWKGAFHFTCSKGREFRATCSDRFRSRGRDVGSFGGEPTSRSSSAVGQLCLEGTRAECSRSVHIYYTSDYRLLSTYLLSLECAMTCTASRTTIPSS